MNYVGDTHVKVPFCCSRNNAELQCKDFPRTDSDVLLLNSFQDFLQGYGRPVLHALCDCTWRQARALFATNFNIGYSLLPLPPVHCNGCARHYVRNCGFKMAYS